MVAPEQLFRIFKPSIDWRPTRIANDVKINRGLSVRSGRLSVAQRRRVLAYIETHIDFPLKAIELADMLGVSKSYFNRAFKANFALPPRAYILRRRIELAQGLMLSDSRLSLSQIALNVGLSDQSHLSRVFRRLVGETPRNWRARHQSIAHKP